MTADIELLPLPAEDYVDDEGLWEKRHGPYSHEQMEDYARACVAHATAPLQAEIEALRAEVEALRDGLDYLRQMQGVPDVLELRAKAARAERLAEALLELCNVIDGHEVHVAVEGKAAHARAALRDHDQEGCNP